MLTKIDTMTTTSYRYGEFIIDVVETPDIFDAWLSHKDFGIKEYMFGLSKDNPESRTLEQALAIVDANLANEPYMKTYRQTYMEDD